MPVKKCRICKSTKLKKIFSLGKQPLANSLLSSPKEKTQYYPLEWLRCTHCNLIQLSYVVPKETMFDDYFYIPSLSKDHLKDFNFMANFLIKKLELKKGDLVVDIGSSDGSLLFFFDQQGMTVLGVEPAKNIESSVKTYHEYFTPKLAKEMVLNHGRAKLVTATNVFAHIDNVDEFLEALDILLDEDGVFFARFPDVRNLLKENQFDTIYHEHLSYFTNEPLYHLFNDPRFELFKIDHSNIHGGSMMIYVKRRPDLMSAFIENVENIKERLQKIVKESQKNGQKVVGFGAAAKGTILLNYCDLHLDYVIDDTPYKIGKYIPGVYTPIVSSKILNTDKPDIILILAWNWRDEIIRRYPGYIYIVPIPEVETFQ